MPLTRERDVAEAQVLFEQAQQRGCIPLPQLTDTDLCVFSDSFATLADKDVWLRWCELAGEQRDELATTAQKFLAYRKLLRPIVSGADDAPRFDIQPKLGYILAARARPTVLGVCAVPGQLGVGDVRMFVLQDEVHAEPVVVLERSTARGLGTFGRIRQYSLATAEAAGGVAADWVRESIETDRDAAGLPRTIDFYRHSEGEPLTGEQFSIVATGTGLVLSRSGADQLVDQRGLAGHVAQALRTVR